MHACVTGALAGIPDELVRSLGVPEEFFASRDRILADAAQGAFYAVAMSERGAGSRLSAMTTRYEAVEEGYRIKGAKSFVSGSGHADGYLIAARSSADDSVVVAVPGSGHDARPDRGTHLGLARHAGHLVA